MEPATLGVWKIIRARVSRRQILPEYQPLSLCKEIHASHDETKIVKLIDEGIDNNRTIKKLKTEMTEVKVEQHRQGITAGGAA